MLKWLTSIILGFVKRRKIIIFIIGGTIGTMQFVEVHCYMEKPKFTIFAKLRFNLGKNMS